VVTDLYFKFLEDEELFLKESKSKYSLMHEKKERLVCDFIAGMTDRYALNLYKRIFLPKPWMIL